MVSKNILHPMGVAWVCLPTLAVEVAAGKEESSRAEQARVEATARLELVKGEVEAAQAQLAQVQGVQGQAPWPPRPSPGPSAGTLPGALGHRRVFWVLLQNL